jgi:hypothetical protein
MNNQLLTFRQWKSLINQNDLKAIFDDLRKKRYFKLDYNFENYLYDVYVNYIDEIKKKVFK